ncbi:FecR domain-containing protein [Pedobacter sp. KR3-3]|uniref:FecR domain-containing protein n=1 Tax=Pedobacter albus TaxID=3113905 RepID=A0ABU7I5X2_9SPHI|nr:FecR domain-containing protein [Pedobacter sp. KR3-3]MEE1944878.1 FecR domain-containing protein [Pedobacter sp. KR3-3]
MDQIDLLFAKFAKNECSAQELEYLLKYFAEGNDETALKRNIKKQLSQTYQSNSQLDMMVEEVFENIKGRIGNPNPVKLRPQFAIYRYVAAAVIVLCASVGLWTYFSSSNLKKQEQVANSPIMPGGNKAMLTLANGAKIDLTHAVNGALAKEAGIEITKTADGQLRYEIKDQHQTQSFALYNTIETPKGGQYQIHLPDGTKVWLNAATSLKYPLSFTGAKERKVELTGEAYFEVAKDKAHPFKVLSAGQEVQVMGTHFNVNAYADEGNIKTTLLEGLVRVTTPNHADEILKPGQQAVLSQNQLNVVAVDADAAAAWKNGRFAFVDEPIESIMRKVARWYDVEIVYKGDMREKVFAGTISRYGNIETLLNTIANTNTISFKIEGRRVIVMD